LAWGRKSQVRTLVLNFIVMALKMLVYSPQNHENGNFWYKFSPQGVDRKS